MGSTLEPKFNRQSVDRPSGKVISPSTEVAEISLSDNFDVELVLQPGSSPIVSLDLLDDLEKTAAFSKKLFDGGYARADSLFLTRSNIAGIFLLGGDLALFRYYIEKQDMDGLRRYGRKAVRAIWSLINGLHSERLTISFVNGEAQGGGFECAIGSNVLISTRGATFGFPESLFGLFPGMGAAQLLTARSDAYAAKTLLAKSSRYPAEMLQEMGIIDYLIDEGDLDDVLLDIRTELQDKGSRRHFTDRFSSVSYEDLVDTVDEWVYQALRLEQRKLDVMGVILKAQSRLLKQKPKPTITKPNSIANLTDFEFNCIARSSSNGPISLRPKPNVSLNARQALVFLKENAAWVEQNLQETGAILLQGMPGKGAKWLSSVTAALGGAQSDYFFDRIEQRRQVGAGIFSLNNQTNYPSFSAGAFNYPPNKTILYRDLQPSHGGSIRYFDARKMLDAIPIEVTKFLDGQIIKYSWQLQSERRRDGEDVSSWQYVFGTMDKSKVAKECFERGLFYRWQESLEMLEIWTESQPINLHPATGQRLWRNQIHDFCVNQEPTKIRGIRRILEVGDGSPIPEWVIKEIRHTISEHSSIIRWDEGDILLLDSHITAFNCEPSDSMSETFIALR